MLGETEIVSCRGAGCNKRLRIPAGRSLIVTCPECKTTWEESPFPQYAAEKHGARRVLLRIAIALLLAGGIWNKAWLPTGLFLLAIIAWRICRHHATSSQTLCQKTMAVLWEASASLCGAAAIGLGLVVALINVLNFYSYLAPGQSPSWLLTLETGIVRITSWFASGSNKIVLAVLYLALLALSVAVNLIARRYEKDWRPVGTLSAWKQRLTKATVVLQVMAFFTFFSQIPLGEHAARIAEELRWRYGVAIRAEQQFQSKRLIAEQLREAAKAASQSENRDNKDTFVSQLKEFASKLRPVPTPELPKPNVNLPPPGSPPDFSWNPPSWRPPSWPKPPPDVGSKISRSTPLQPGDYLPSNIRPESHSPRSPSPLERASGEPAWTTADVVANQVAAAEPALDDKIEIADPPSSRQLTDLTGPIKTTEQWAHAEQQVSEAQVRTDIAQQRYGQAVHAALEAIGEFAGLQIPANPIVEAWIDLLIDNISDRVHGYIFSKEHSAWSRLSSHLSRLFSPHETAAEQLVADIRNRIQASQFGRAEELIGELRRRYSTTKSGGLADALAEDASFQMAQASYTSRADSLDRAIENSSSYLKHFGSSPRASHVRQWLRVAKHDKQVAAEKVKATAEADAEMVIYLRFDCPNSQRFVLSTLKDANVKTEIENFRLKINRLDDPETSQHLVPSGYSALPIIVFKNKAGVVGVIEGHDAIDPVSFANSLRTMLTRNTSMPNYSLRRTTPFENFGSGGPGGGSPCIVP